MKLPALALLLAVSLAASAQEARWAQMSQQVEQLRQQGRTAQAIPLAQQTVQVAAATFGPQDRRVGLSLDALGVLLTDQDDLGGAETSLRRALDILKKSAGPESKEAGQTLLHLAKLYSSHGRWGEAEGAFHDALTADLKAYPQTDPHVADVLFYGSSLLIDEGKLYDAARVIRGAIAIYANAGPAYTLKLVASYNVAGEVVEYSGDHKVAETLYQRAMDIGEKNFGPNNSDLAVSLMGLGNVYKSEERYADAAPLFERSLAILAHNVAPTDPDLVEAEVNIALFYYAWDKPERAGPWFDKYLGNRIAQMRANAATMSEKDRLVAYATLPGTFPIYFSFATRYHDRDPALAGKVYDALLVERGFVAESAASIRARIVASGDTQALVLLDKIAAAKTQLAALSQSNSDDPAHRTQIAQLAQEANQMEQELARRSATLSEANTLAVATWRDVQKALKPGEAAVEITRFQFHTGKTFVANRIYIALVLTAQSRFPQLIVLGDSTDLEAAPLTNFRLVVAKTRGVTAEPEPGAPAASEATSVDTSAAYNGFWKPIEPALTGVRRVYVAADGVLSQIPIGLLSDSTGKLLIEKYQLRCVNSTRDILRAQHSATVRSAVLVGNPKFDLTPTVQRTASTPSQPPSSSAATQPSVNLSGGPLHPLPGTEVEVTAIEKLLRQSGWQTTLYTGDRALKTSIQKVRGPRVVHIATHGFFLEDQRPPDKSGRDVRLNQAADDPMLRSGLFFAGANRTRAGAARAAGQVAGQDDGVLTAYEASQLNLQGTELVVLSACETGLGEQGNGEGVFGLRRALQEAGAESVMMSMWSVPDQETQELMSLFYAKWLGGLEKPEALRQAQLEEREVVRKRYGKDLPYYWGAFVLVSR